MRLTLAPPPQSNLLPSEVFRRDIRDQHVCNACKVGSQPPRISSFACDTHSKRRSSQSVEQGYTSETYTGTCEAKRQCQGCRSGAMNVVRGTLLSVRTGGLESLLMVLGSFTSISSCFLTALPLAWWSINACDVAEACLRDATCGTQRCSLRGGMRARRTTRRLELEEVHGLIPEPVPRPSHVSPRPSPHISLPTFRRRRAHHASLCVTRFVTRSGGAPGAFSTLTFSLCTRPQRSAPRC